MLLALAHAGYAPAVAAVSANIVVVPAGVIERLLLAFMLRALETFIAMYGELVSGSIVVMTIASNVRHITEDPALARRYGPEDSPPPDSERRPITVRALAKALDMPFETVRRHVATLVTTGDIVWRAGGVIVPVATLSSDRHIYNNRLLLTYFEQMLDSLVGLSARAPPESERFRHGDAIGARRMQWSREMVSTPNYIGGEQ